MKRVGQVLIVVGGAILHAIVNWPKATPDSTCDDVDIDDDDVDVDTEK